MTGLCPFRPKGLFTCVGCEFHISDGMCLLKQIRPTLVMIWRQLDSIEEKLSQILEVRDKQG